MNHHPERFRLRLMEPADIDTIVPVEAELFAGDPPWTARQFESELAGVPETRWYVVAEDEDGALAGYAGLLISIDTADIQTLAVLPEYQRCGLGTRLLAALIAHARERRVADLLLEVRADNDAALALYRSHGFEQIAWRRGYYGNGRYDVLVLRCRVPSTPSE
jgi:ribosomal-protein-alanine N-acetyltransferase